MIKFCSLSSGSKGNTAYVEINGDKFLKDEQVDKINKNILY